MKILLLNISDLHVSEGNAENEGLVLSKFVEDVQEQLQTKTYDSAYVLIGGDLVFSATDENYQKFDEKIVLRLMKILSIERDHFIIVPGNHDINQAFIGDVKESFLPIFEKMYGEHEFNDLIRKPAQEITIFGKFNAFNNYMHKIMNATDYSLTCGCYSLSDKWSVHTLNTAVLSLGGYNQMLDNGHMGIDTRTLQENLQSDKHPNKILLMHHPEYFCMDWVKHELKKMYQNDFALVLSGHTHDQDCFCTINKKKNYIRCEAPQLFTDKYDSILGYCFIELQDSGVSRISYREWVEKKNGFQIGRSFSNDDSGVCEFELNDMVMEPKDDLILSKMKDKLRTSMNAFVGQPYIWVDRYLSDDRIDQVFRLTKSTMYSENDIINMAKNLKVVAPSLYGLTCYGLHFLITCWTSRRQFGIYINAEGVRTSKFANLVDGELESFNKSRNEVSWVVIDNWNPYKKDQQGISKFIQTELPNAHVVLLSQYSEFNFGNHVNDQELLPIDYVFYLTPLKHEQERLIVDEYNKKKFIDESDIVLHKLDEDIKNFNLHRTPYNCMTLMTVFKDSFDRNPVNRTAVLESILNIIFDNTKLPNYKGSSPDVKDCEFCLGYFCSQIIDKEYYFFSWDDFYSIIKNFCDIKKTDIDIRHLFDILCYNSIIIKEGNSYVFHFTFWVYYFVASWMYVDSDFAKRMLDGQTYQRYPEVLEFYTGKDRKRCDAVHRVTADLHVAAKSVQEKAGIAENKNPFAFLRFNRDKSQTERIIKEIDDNIQQSNLPQSLKDQVADINFNPSAAFDQAIGKVYTDFSVGYLVNIITIACKVLRNSDHLDADIKQQLLSEITNALKVFSNIIYLVSHLFAHQGFIHLPEYNLKLTDSFKDLNEQEKRIRIITSIPYNLMLMFKEDLYSRKLSPVYIAQLKEENDKAEKHLLASFIVYKQPEGWEPAIREYIDDIGKESYYLGTLIESMSNTYYAGELEKADRMRMNNLLKSALYKSDHGRLPSSIAEINKLRLRPVEEDCHSTKDNVQNVRRLEDPMATNPS